ncbi:Hypothetical predicted protein [Podarcis lilfordi]|uniref:Uncharacterized protein n=1 Tax=Podarcis lilfordi TaxID=74358 RepID=A0AA35KBG4_9SAUR|nr:Hypothetical predicted protein [Podarcis lilfordi]
MEAATGRTPEAPSAVCQIYASLQSSRNFPQPEEVKRDSTLPWAPSCKLTAKLRLDSPLLADRSTSTEQSCVA